MSAAAWFTPARLCEFADALCNGTSNHSAPVRYAISWRSICQINEQSKFALPNKKIFRGAKGRSECAERGQAIALA